jgi:hypothetical protein
LRRDIEKRLTLLFERAGRRWPIRSKPKGAQRPGNAADADAQQPEHSSIRSGWRIRKKIARAMAIAGTAGKHDRI